MSEHANIYEALFAIQGEVAELTKTADNPFYRSKYVPLPDLLKEVLPLCQQHGVLLTQPVVGMEVHTTFRHVASETEVSDAYPLHCADTTNPQALGTAVAYARRYGLKAGLAIIELDDDGNAASTRPGQAAPQNAQPRPQTRPQGSSQGQGRPPAQGRAPAAPQGSTERKGPEPREDDASVVWDLARLLDEDAEAKGEKFRIISKDGATIGLFGKVADNIGIGAGKYDPAEMDPHKLAKVRGFYEYLCKKNDIVMPNDDGLPF